MDEIYPVSYDIDPPEQYNRWTVAFRLILAIPQLALVGGGGYYFIGANGWYARGSNSHDLGFFLNGGVLTFVMGVVVFFAWWAILFTGRFPRSWRDFCLMVFRWSENVHAYMALQAAPYPPFGDGPYPLRLQVTPTEQYNRWTVACRIILAIPHIVVLFGLSIAQAIVTVIAWVAILFSGQYPPDLFRFSVGVSRWSARVSAYMLLLVDEYPPFTLNPTAADTLTPTQVV